MRKKKAKVSVRRATPAHARTLKHVDKKKESKKNPKQDKLNYDYH